MGEKGSDTCLSFLLRIFSFHISNKNFFFVDMDPSILKEVKQMMRSGSTIQVTLAQKSKKVLFTTR